MSLRENNNPYGILFWITMLAGWGCELISLFMTLRFLIIEFTGDVSPNSSLYILYLIGAIVLGLIIDSAKCFFFVWLILYKKEYVDIELFNISKPPSRENKAIEILFIIGWCFYVIFCFLLNCIVKAVLFIKHELIAIRGFAYALAFGALVFSLIASYSWFVVENRKSTRNSDEYIRVQTEIIALESTIKNNNKRIESCWNEINRTRWHYVKDSYRYDINRYEFDNKRLRSEIASKKVQLDNMLAIGVVGVNSFNLSIVKICKVIFHINISSDDAIYVFSFFLELIGFGFLTIWTVYNKEILLLWGKRISENRLIRSIANASQSAHKAQQYLYKIAEEISSEKYNGKIDPEKILYILNTHKTSKWAQRVMNGLPLPEDVMKKIDAHLKKTNPELPSYDPIDEEIDNMVEIANTIDGNGHDDDLTLENQDEILPENTDEKNDFDERFRERKKPLTLTGKNVHDDVEKIVHKNMKKTVHETVHKNDSKNGQKKTVLELKNVLRTKFQGKSDPFILYIWGQWSELSTKRKSYGNVSKLVSQVLPGNRTISKTYVYNLINER